jgi:predicted dehydrogenase
VTELRIGVAGLGEMGVIHARNVRAVEGMRLVALGAARLERGTRIAGELAGGEIPVVSYERLFAADDIDAVVIATRTTDHAEHTVAALAGGKHVLLEKPGAHTLAAHALIGSAAAAHPTRVLQLAYMRRYDPLFADARRMVARGVVGTPLVVHSSAREDYPAGEDSAALGGTVLDIGVHDLDTACWFLEDVPVRVHAVSQTLVDHGCDVDNLVMSVAFARGGAAAIDISRTSAVGHDVRLEVVGTAGSLGFGGPAGDGPITLLTAAARDRYPDGSADRWAAAYRAELEAFGRACRGEVAGWPTLADDRAAVAAAVAARASAVHGEALEVGVDCPWC